MKVVVWGSNKAQEFAKREAEKALRLATIKAVKTAFEALNK